MFGYDFYGIGNCYWFCFFYCFYGRNFVIVFERINKLFDLWKKNFCYFERKKDWIMLCNM